MNWFEGFLCVLGTIFTMVVVSILHALPFIMAILILYWIIF